MHTGRASYPQPQKHVPKGLLFSLCIEYIDNTVLIARLDIEDWTHWTVSGQPPSQTEVKKTKLLMLHILGWLSDKLSILFFLYIYSITVRINSCTKQNVCNANRFFFCGWSSNVEWTSNRSKTSPKRCLFSIPPPSQDFYFPLGLGRERF